MKDEVIREIEQGMLESLDNAQREQLHRVLEHVLYGAEITRRNREAVMTISNEELAERFYTAKKLEGCSEKTIRYYRLTIRKTLETVKLPLIHVTTEHLRTYLSDYQTTHTCSKVNMDNIRRILSSFFAWLEDENYILDNVAKSGMRY